MSVKAYTDKALLDKVKSLKSFKGIPEGYWVLGVRSTEDTPNKFDDKFYVFKGEDFQWVTSGTTNPGKSGLLNPVNKKGTAIVKSEEWYYDVWKLGKHKNKIPAYVQNKPIKYYRDNNKNLKSEEIGRLYTGMIGINLHTTTYLEENFKNKYFSTEEINSWSLGCQVINKPFMLWKLLQTEQELMTYCLIKEF